MKKRYGLFAVLFVTALSLTAQEPQCPTCPIYAVNAKYVQGAAPGYAPTAGSGLILNLAAGRVRCGSTMTNYAGGTLTLANNTTNYVYLDTGSSCAPNSNTTGYSAGLIAVATVVTSGGAITTVTDDRTFGLSMATVASVSNKRTCGIIVGSDDASAALTNANLGPQGRLCFIPAASTLLEIDVAADAGTPNVIAAKNHAGTVSNLVSSALTTASSGGIACSNAGGTTGIDGATTCSGTLQNTSLAAGDYLQLVSGTAGGTAKRMSIFITYTVN